MIAANHPGRRAMCWMVLGAILVIVARANLNASLPPGSRPWVEVIAIDGPINPAVAAYIDDALAIAERDGAGALVIELDTPGGMLTSTQHIVEDLLGARVPVIVYVTPSGASAASAGTFITEAANIAAMAPGTTIGAAHPVEENGTAPIGVMGQKIENFAASFARSIAISRGRNPDWVEKAVRQSVAIGEGEALDKHVIDLVAPDIPSLLAQASGRTIKVAGHPVTLALAGASLRRHQMTLGQRVLNLLADPNVMYLLLMAGFVGFYFEFAHPGAYFPGVAGAICMLLALTSFEVIPINIGGLLLLVLGVGMLMAEAFVTSYGVLGIGGVIALLLGSLFLVNSSATNVGVSHDLIYGAAAALTAIILALGYVITGDRRKGARTGAEGMIGEVGQVRDPIAPDLPGRVFIHGEIWRATSNEPLAPGARARVVGVEGLEIRVSKA